MQVSKQPSSTSSLSQQEKDASLHIKATVTLGSYHTSLKQPDSKRPRGHLSTFNGIPNSLGCELEEASAHCRGSLRGV